MKSILFVQHGDFRDAYLRFADGGPETYRDQRRSVDFVASLAPNARVTTIALGKHYYRTKLAPNLWAVGLELNKIRASDITRVFDEIAPSHVILRSPDLRFLREVRRRNLWLLPSFADIFVRKGPRAALRNTTLRRLLLRCRASCISNHSLNASRSLVTALGLPPERVVPWDWSKVPLAGSAKNAMADSSHPTAFFAGALTEDKGVGDCLSAVAELRQEGLCLSMTFAGPGNLDEWNRRAASLGISNQVQFLGMIPNAQVRQEMRKHDMVVVPSRHSYAEGLPNTIYEGLASRSVLIISDHPAFAGRLVPGEEALVFAAADPKALARCVKQVTENSTIYRRISENSDRAHDRLYVGIEWSTLVSTFLEDPENGQGWVENNSLKYLEL